MFAQKLNSNVRQDFEETLETFFEEQTSEEEKEPTEGEEPSAASVSSEQQTTSQKPKILFSFFYSHLNSHELVESSLPANKPENLHIVSGSSDQLDFDHQIEEVCQLFRVFKKINSL